MCGIFLGIANGSESSEENLKLIFQRCSNGLIRRGPNSECIPQGYNIDNLKFILSASVLWLQGIQVTKQPVETKKSWFLYNGDIYDDNLIPSDIRGLQGDTVPLLEVIEESGNIKETFETVKGPFAFILLDKVNSLLYFARDTFGRRSLLIGKNESNFVLTSVASRSIDIPIIELPALGIYCLDLKHSNLNQLVLYPWKTVNQNFTIKLEELRKIIPVNVVPNVDVLEAEQSLSKLTCPEEFNLLFESLIGKELKEAFQILGNNASWNNTVVQLHKYLEVSMRRRIESVPRFCSDCIRLHKNCNHCNIGILFSGGVDCSVLALLADKYIDPERQIDLMNVSFDQGKDNFDTPDRITARQTYEELQKLRPSRKWKLIEIDVLKECLMLLRSGNIGDLIFPLNTILDESLGCALWFAASSVCENYDSPARVLLVGMGADELFGGYTRHRAAFKRGEWTALSEELNNDWKNISHRNLARDDRVVSDQGRQIRTPYLDEDFVQFVRNLKPWEKCFPSEKITQGFGDKMLLRCLANNIGLKQAAVMRKRAMQFGTRIANKNENAYEKSPRL